MCVELLSPSDSRDDRDRNDDFVRRHPKLIVEILSKSTAREDLGRKMREYQSIDTLEEDVTLDSRKRWAQRSSRVGRAWTPFGPRSSGTLDLTSIALSIDLDASYDIVGVHNGMEELYSWRECSESAESSSRATTTKR